MGEFGEDATCAEAGLCGSVGSGVEVVAVVDVGSGSDGGDEDDGSGVVVGVGGEDVGFEDAGVGDFGEGFEVGWVFDDVFDELGVVLDKFGVEGGTKGDVGHVAEGNFGVHIVEDASVGVDVEGVGGLRGEEVELVV